MLGTESLLGVELALSRDDDPTPSQASAVREGFRGVVVTRYLGMLRAFSRGARLYLASAAVMGFTIFGGAYSLLLNLYLLRLGYGPEVIGVVHATALLGWALACLPAGVAGRLLGSRRAMSLGMSLTMAGHALLPLAELFSGRGRTAWIVGTYLLGNVSVALYDVNSQPFLIEVSGSEERDHLFSVQAAIWPLAGFFGSLAGGLAPSLAAALAGVGAESAAAFRYPLIVSALVIGLGWWSISRARGAVVPPPAVPRVRPADRRRGAGARGALALAALGVVIALQATVEGAARTFFTVYMDSSLHVDAARIGLLVAVGQLAAAPAALVAPLLTRRWGHRAVFLWGSLAAAVGFLPLALVPHWSAAGFGYMAVIALVSITRPAVTVYLMESSPVFRRAVVSAVATMSTGLCWSATSLGGGFVIAGLGYSPFFVMAAAATACGALLFGRLRHGVDQRPAAGPE